MAKLPGEGELQRRSVSPARVATGVAAPKFQNTSRHNIRVAEPTGLGQGVEGLGRSMIEIGEIFKEKEALERENAEKERKAREAIELRSAQSRWARKSIEIESSFVGDTDFATYEERYAAAMIEAQEEIGAGISGATVRRGFYDDTNVDVARGSLRMQKSAYEEKTKEALLHVDNEIAENLDMLANAKTDAERDTLLTMTNDLIDTLPALGVTEEELRKQKRTTAKAAAKIMLVSAAKQDPHKVIQELESGEGFAQYLNVQERDDVATEIRMNFNAAQQAVETERTMKAFQEFPKMAVAETGTELKRLRDERLAEAKTPEEKVLIQHMYEHRKAQLTLTPEEEREDLIEKGVRESEISFQVRQIAIANGYRAPKKEDVTEFDKAENKRLFGERIISLGIEYDPDDKEWKPDPKGITVDQLYALQKDLASLRDGLLNSSDIIKFQDGLDSMYKELAENNFKGRSKYQTIFSNVATHLGKKYDTGKGLWNKAGNDAKYAPPQAISRMVGLTLEAIEENPIDKDLPYNEKLAKYKEISDIAIERYQRLETPSYKPAHSTLANSGETLVNQNPTSKDVEVDTELKLEEEPTLPQVNTAEDWNALPVGTQYLDPNGNKKVKR